MTRTVAVAGRWLSSTDQPTISPGSTVMSVTSPRPGSRSVTPTRPDRMRSSSTVGRTLDEQQLAGSCLAESAERRRVVSRRAPGYPTRTTWRRWPGACRRWRS